MKLTDHKGFSAWPSIQPLASKLVLRYTLGNREPHQENYDKRKMGLAQSRLEELSERADFKEGVICAVIPLQTASK